MHSSKSNPLTEHKSLLTILAASFLLTALGSVVVLLHLQKTQVQQNLSQTATQKTEVEKQLATVEKDLETLRAEDQFVRNERLQEEIENIQKTYDTAVTTYEDLLALKEKTDDTEKMDDLFAKTLTFLSERNYTSASAQLAALNKDISEAEKEIASKFTIPTNVVAANTPPGSGYRRQRVSTELGDYLVDVVSADLGSTRVIVDTASDGDCSNDCPVLPLASYVSRNGAFAGINGSYFCPASYPSCAGKTNSFDTLLMNKNKTYFNSDNNVYSTVPAAIFGNGWVRFVGQSLEWGRDTGVDGVIANQPLLLIGSNIQFGGDGDPKKGSKGARSFVANQGNTIYIGVVFNATVAEVAHVLKAMGMENAINLDSGGSTALWSGGYKVGPGRNIPNAILFVGK